MGDARGAAAAGHPAEVAAALRILAAGWQRGRRGDRRRVLRVRRGAQQRRPGRLRPPHRLAARQRRRSSPSTTARARRPRRAPTVRARRGRHRRRATTGPTVEARANEFGASRPASRRRRRASAPPTSGPGGCRWPSVARAGDRSWPSAGVPVDWHLALTIVQRLRGHPRAARPRRAFLLRTAIRPPPATIGATRATLDTSALAETLRRIAREGAAGCPGRRGRRGRRARRARRRRHPERRRSRGVRAARRLGGPTAYRGRDVATAEDDLGHRCSASSRTSTCRGTAPGSADELHLLAEAFGHAFADVLTWAGDPAALPELSSELRGSPYAAARAAVLRHRPRPRRAALEPGRRPGSHAPAGVGGTAGTTQVAVADDAGGMAVVITTIGQDFGCLVYVPELGSLLNSAMVELRPAARPSQLDRTGPHAALRRPRDDRRRERAGRARLRWLGRLPHHEQRDLAPRSTVLDHGLSADAAVSRAARVVPGRGDVRRRPRRQRPCATSWRPRPRRGGGVADARRRAVRARLARHRGATVRFGGRLRSALARSGREPFSRTGRTAGTLCNSGWDNARAATPTPGRAARRPIARRASRRSLEVLLSLGSDAAIARGGLGVTRIAEMLGREKSQVSRTLKTLADYGLVDRDPDTLAYRLGWRIYALASLAGERRLLDDGAPGAAPPGDDVRGARVPLGSPGRRHADDPVRVAPPTAVQAVGWVGRMTPAYCTSVGQALLLDHDRAALQRLLRRHELRPLGAAHRDAAWRRLRRRSSIRMRARLRGGRRGARGRARVRRGAGARRRAGASSPRSTSRRPSSASASGSTRSARAREAAAGLGSTLSGSGNPPRVSTTATPSASRCSPSPAGCAGTPCRADVRRHLALVLLDLAAVCEAGRTAPAAAHRRRLRRRGARAATRATALLDGRRLSAPGAAWANGVLANVLDYDDGHRITKGHPGAMVIPAALATAEAVGASATAFLEAVLVGYEVALRAGVLIHEREAPVPRLGVLGLARRGGQRGAAPRAVRRRAAPRHRHRRVPRADRADAARGQRPGDDQGHHGLGRVHGHQQRDAGGARLHGARQRVHAGRRPTSSSAPAGSCWSCTSSRTRAAAGRSPASTRRCGCARTASTRRGSPSSRCAPSRPRTTSLAAPAHHRGDAVQPRLARGHRADARALRRRRGAARASTTSAAARLVERMRAGGRSRAHRARSRRGG